MQAGFRYGLKKGLDNAITFYGEGKRLPEQ